eukprot:9738899-Prorocentrum_lima.AAC.1
MELKTSAPGSMPVTDTIHLPLVRSLDKVALIWGVAIAWPPPHQTGAPHVGEQCAAGHMQACQP